MQNIADHTLRKQLVNELHARPFPVIDAPSSAAFLAIKPEMDAAARDRTADVAHLTELLDHYGAPHPKPDATHYFGAIGKHFVKWESHTEFVTYTIFGSGVNDIPFGGTTFDTFPKEWLEKAPGVRMVSILMRVELETDCDSIAAKLEDWFVPESLAASYVLDQSAVVASDFRLDAAGHSRFAVFVRPGTGNRRIGRIVQRLCEIETYKTMSMLGHARCGQLERNMGAIDGRLNELMVDMSQDEAEPEETLKALLKVSTLLESLLANSQFRFGATGAYGALVNQRIDILHEERFGEKQTFSEFMMRRFDPAMRTVKSTQNRLHALADRATRAGELLRTSVDVERSAQNQRLLESMDHRADVQLRLQRTVEGLSVVAISYYAVNLLIYVFYPAATAFGMSKGWLGAALTPLVAGAVYLVVRRIRLKSH